MTMQKSEFEQTATNASIIGVTAFGGALVGFLLQLAVAYYFGAGSDTDAYFMAQSTSELISKLLLGGSIVSVFIPLFIQQLNTEGKTIAWKNALNIMHVTAALFLILTIAVGLGATPFVHFIAPGFTAAQSALTISLLRVLLPSFFFLFVVELGTAMLQSVKHFTIPALLRIIAPLVSVITVVILTGTIGIYSLAVGALVGSVIQVALIVWALSRQGFSYHFILEPYSPTIKHLLRLVYPFILSMLVTQAAGIVYRILVSHLASGSLASLKFAEKITQLATIIFLTSVVSAMYPVMAEKASRQDMVGLKNSIATAIRLIFFVSLPLVIGIAILRVPLIEVIYQHGSFTPESAVQTNIALFYLALGLVTNGISAVFGYATLAMQKTKAAVTVTIASQIVAISLFFYLTPLMGHAGLALASSLVPLAIGFFYIVYLSRFIPKIWSVFWHVTYFKTIIGSAVLATILIVCLAVFSELPSSLTTSLIRLIIPTVVATIIYAAISYFWHIPEMRQVTTLISQKMSKLKKIPIA